MVKYVVTFADGQGGAVVEADSFGWAPESVMFRRTDKDTPEGQETNVITVAQYRLEAIIGVAIIEQEVSEDTPEPS